VLVLRAFFYKFFGYNLSFLFILKKDPKRFARFSIRLCKIYLGMLRITGDLSHHEKNF